MITVINGTNRKGNLTQPFAEKVVEILQSKSNEEIRLIELEHLPSEALHSGMYSPDGQSSAVAELQDEALFPSGKWIFISPEYNGSYPGVLKLFIDAVSIREYKKTFSGKKAGLIGTASGRAGNLRGLDHLTGALNHVGMTVFPNKLPISSIKGLLDESGKVTDEGAIGAMESFVDGFLAY